MTQKRPDLRVRRTHALLRETLIDLIAEKGFDAVSVGEIAERAMINRSTFYRHYPDKYALVTSIFEEAVDQLISELGQERLEALDWMASALGTGAEQPVSPQMQHTLAAWVAFFEHFASHPNSTRRCLASTAVPGLRPRCAATPPRSCTNAGWHHRGFEQGKQGA
jgi:AcrR family transcriptional regulator